MKNDSSLSPLAPLPMLGLAIFLALGLTLERPELWGGNWDAWQGQILTSILAWIVFFALYLHSAHLNARPALLTCLLLATLGEIFCSLIWGLYDYRFYNIPLYVPPGHVLMFVLGISLAPRLPNWTVWLVPLITAPYVVIGSFFGFDQFALLLFAFFCACLLNGLQPKVYAAMFLLALGLEIHGTYLGNWTWKAAVPYWGFSNINPPLAAGAFYCVLDFLVLRFNTN